MDSVIHPLVQPKNRSHPPDWLRHAIWWQVYPLGFVGAYPSDKPPTAAEHRLTRILDWLDHAVDLGVSGIALGPIFASATKADATPALGLEATRAVGARLPLPWVAIGGIDAGNAPAIMATGAAGLAVVSAIAAADDPEQAASALKSAMAGAYAA